MKMVAADKWVGAIIMIITSNVALSVSQHGSSLHLSNSFSAFSLFDNLLHCMMDLSSMGVVENVVKFKTSNVFASEVAVAYVGLIFTE